MKETWLFMLAWIFGWFLYYILSMGNWSDTKLIANSLRILVIGLLPFCTAVTAEKFIHYDENLRRFEEWLDRQENLR